MVTLELSCLFILHFCKYLYIFSIFAHMDDVISEILAGAAAKTDSVDNASLLHVDKAIDVEIDLGNLLLTDPNPLDTKKLKSDKEGYLKSLARDNAQLLVNKLWQLKAERVDNVIVVQLPEPTTRLPREKPLPAPEKPTKWEQFARMKGIQNKKKGRMVYDEQAKEYRPRWGYKRANDDTKDWLIPVPENADPYEDQFEKRLKAKKERVEKNELQRLRNIARNMKGKVPGVGLTPVVPSGGSGGLKLKQAGPQGGRQQRATAVAADKSELDEALAATRVSNASMGMFMKELPKEGSNVKLLNKRKFMPNHSEKGAEKKRALDILSKLGSEPVVDKEKAASALNKAQHSKRSENRLDDDSYETPRKKNKTGYGSASRPGPGGGKKPGRFNSSNHSSNHQKGQKSFGAKKQMNKPKNSKKKARGKRH